MADADTLAQLAAAGSAALLKTSDLAAIPELVLSLHYQEPSTGE
jgi:hypothetical protein